MVKRWFALVAVTMWGAGAMANPVCEQGGGGVVYPLAEVLRNEAIPLHIAEYMRIDWDAQAKTGFSMPDGTEYRAAVIEELAPLRPVHADVRLLALLDHAAGPSKRIMLPLTTASPSGVYDLFLGVLDRQGLNGQAAAMRAAQAAFAVWEGTANSRRSQWVDERGKVINRGLEVALDAASAAYLAARPGVLDTAEALIAADPELAKRYEDMRIAAGDDERLPYLLREIWSCLDGGWWSPEEADAALGVLPRAQRDLVVLDTFMAEAMNGSVHQFFYNSSGTLAPELAEIFDRHGLAGHAAGIRQGMAVYPGDYLRDTTKRREVMLTFSEEQDNILYELTVWADDGKVWALMPKIAKDAGIWPK